MISQPELGPNELLISTIRHGLTELNRTKRTGGRTDVPLIEPGRMQAREACAAFAGTPFDVAYASPLKRAIETAQLVAGVAPPQLRIDELCTERSFGDMEGLTRAEIVERLPQVNYVPIAGVHYSLNPPGGETFAEVHARARLFFAKLLAGQRGRRVLVFSHQNFLQQLHAVMRGRDELQALESDILNCELNQFHIGAGGQLRAHRTIQLCKDANAYPSF